MELRCVSSPAISLLPSTSSSCSSPASRIAFGRKPRRSGSSSGNSSLKFRLGGGGVVRATSAQSGGDLIGTDVSTAVETPSTAFIPAAIDVPVVPAAAPVAVPAAAPVTVPAVTAAPGATTVATPTIDATRVEAEFPGWEKIDAIVRLCYGVGIYGAMALAGKFICSVAGIDCAGGFQPTVEAILNGFGYAAPPIMALLFILDDEVVKYSPHARAIRDVEDEELRSFFYGMSVWQFFLVVTASSVGEELFYRAAVQGGLADMFLRSTELVKDAHGLASLTGLFPPFVPFAQAFAAVITAALTGSLYYVASTPKDPTYVVAPVLKSTSGRDDLKKLFAAWYERRQMRRIYSPLLEGLLALYLGFEWIQTDNILAPMITHGIYSAVVLGHGLLKIHGHRRKLRHRVQQVKVDAKN